MFLKVINYDTIFTNFLPLAQVDPFLLVVQEHPDLQPHPFLPFFQLVLVFHRSPATRIQVCILLCSNSMTYQHLNIRLVFIKKQRISLFQINVQLMQLKGSSLHTSLTNILETRMIPNTKVSVSLVERNYSPVFLVVLGVPFLPPRLLYPEVTKSVILLRTKCGNYFKNAYKVTTIEICIASIV